MNEKDLPLIKDVYSIDSINLTNEISKSSHIKQAIFVFNSDSKEYIKRFDTITQAEKILNIRHEKIKRSIMTGVSINNYIFSYHRLLYLPNK